MMVVSPEDTVVSCSNGQKTLQTLNFYEKTVHGKKMAGGIRIRIHHRILILWEMFWIWLSIQKIRNWW